MALIEKFEKGVAIDVVDSAEKSPGQAIHTLSVRPVATPSTQHPASVPSAKQPRMQSDNPVRQSS